MPRNPRMVLSGFPHHIVQRGHDRQRVFASSCDYQYYLKNLETLSTELQIRVYSFCLMTNHVHLLMEPSQSGATLSRMMKVLAARQTRHVNRIAHRTGTLWEGRFKCSIVETDRYLLACMRYIDLNPVKAAIVEQPDDYEWSSYHAIVRAQKPTFLSFHPILKSLGRDSHDWRTAYKDFVCAEVSDSETKLIRTAVARDQLTGSNRFREQIADCTGRRIESRGPGRPRK